MKIFICGPSGVGKTTLAVEIAKKYNIPFISTSGKSLWEKHGIKSHEELIRKTTADPMGFGLSYQIDLLVQRTTVLKNHKSFVTDRSPVDNLVYTISQLASHITEAQLKEYMDLCETRMKTATTLIYIPFTKAIELEDDGMRITNRYYQQYISNLFDLVLYKENYLSVCRNCIGKLDVWDWETRLRWVEIILDKTNKDNG